MTKAPLIRFTLDTNCLIDLDEARPAAVHVRTIVEAHPARADVAYVAISASEKQKGGGQLETFDLFTQRLERLGIGHLHEAMPLLYFDVGYWDHALLAESKEVELDRKIHEILFPDLPLDWSEFAAASGLGADATPYGTKWHNAKCDVQMLWAHIHEKRDVFVTSDERFLGAKRDALIALGAHNILRPTDAAKLLKPQEKPPISPTPPELAGGKTERPIDRIRNSALSMKVGEDGDGRIGAMIDMQHTLYSIHERAIYAMRLADQIDPQRTNASVPNVQQKVLSLGALDPEVGRTFLTANALFQSKHLGPNFDEKAARQLAFDFLCARRLVVRLKTIGLDISADQLLVEIEPAAPLDDAPQIWPGGPQAGVYVTTSQEAINALLARYEEATAGAVVYAERAATHWEGSIDLGEGSLWSPGLARVPSGTLIVVGPLEFDQQSWNDCAQRVHMATLHALNCGHRVAVLIDTPTPESLHEDLQQMVRKVQKPGDDCEEGLLGIVSAKGDLVRRAPFAGARPRVTTSPLVADLDEIPERARQLLAKALAKRKTGLILFGSWDIAEHPAIEAVAATLAMTQDVGPAARVMPRHRSTPAKDWNVPEAIKALPLLPSIENAFEQGYRRIVFAPGYTDATVIAEYSRKAMLLGGVYGAIVDDVFLRALHHHVKEDGNPLDSLIAILSMLKIRGKHPGLFAADLFVMPPHSKPAPNLGFEETEKFLRENRILRWEEELEALLESKQVTPAALLREHPRALYIEAFLKARASAKKRKR